MPELSDGRDARVQKLIYSGRVGALYWIFIKIILLNLVVDLLYPLLDPRIGAAA